MKELLCRIEGPVEDSARLSGAIYIGCIKSGTSVVQRAQHHFQPQGFTALWLLSESHAAVHTWPEHGYALVNYFSCAENPRIETFEETLREYGFTIKERQIVER